jgi:hypothetical protein
VDEAGATLTDAQQTCGMSVQVKREVLPTLAPQYFHDNSSPNVDDGFPPAALKKAGRGKDHLNNVEQVLVQAAEAGNWTIKVTGFNLSQSQRYSLVVSHPAFVVIEYGSLCERFACPWDVPNLCQRYPRLCQQRLIPIAKGPLPVHFEAPEDRFVLPFNRICQFVIDCPPCAAAGLCPVSQLALRRLPAPMTVEVWARSGRRVYSDRSRNLTKEIRFRPRRGEEYMLVLGPATSAQVGQRFAVPISAAR